MRFKFYKQLNAMDCGPTCLRMVANYYGKHYTAESLRKTAGFNKAGVSLLGLTEAAKKIGLNAIGVHLTFKQLIEDVQLPCILHWDQYHFVILLKIVKTRMLIADPAAGILKINKNDFLSFWEYKSGSEAAGKGTALLLEPTATFFQKSDDGQQQLNWRLILNYLNHSRWQVIQVLFSIVLTSMLQLAFPFLTQSIVDIGINSNNLPYITIVLIAQLMLVFSKSIVEFIRTRLLLQVSTILNLSILSDFWIKLTSLPISYFDSHHTGDTLQRLGDHRQIETFLTGTTLNTIFSTINFIVFGFILAFYNMQLFLIFFFGSTVYFFWIKFFLKIRRQLNYATFDLSAKEKSASLQLVLGMKEIKLHNAEKLKRWEWENIQSRIFKLNFKNLNSVQLQQAGAIFINQGKDALITFIVARLVIQGELSLGAMLAVQYIIGQLTGPIEQFISFAQSAQDARISIERLNEIHHLPDEEDSRKSYDNHLDVNHTIIFRNVSFNYPGSGNDPVIENINLEIPGGKTTAIVGSSGSGKTTILKLLLRFYDFYTGEILLCDGEFRDKSPSFWRSQCGAVLQDGYLFNDTIARNICIGDETPHYEKLIAACKVANILSFIESLPNGFSTIIGTEGNGVSQGQRQRLLIARAVYKDPQYIFFDEATNALDSNNERDIVDNLRGFFNGKTVVIVAHRMSTFKDADKIIVLHNGKIIEEGCHWDLIAKKGHYFSLVKYQLAAETKAMAAAN